MAIVLALGCAVVYGAADFLGGLASRKTSVFGVVAFSQIIGLVALLALLPWLGGPVEAADLWWGAASGLAGAAGLVIFFRTLARGVMSVIAPVTAVTAAAVPVLVGLLTGDRIGVWSAVGIGLALAAVVLVSADGGLTALSQARPASLLPALLAGSMFGIFFVLLDRTGDESGLTPLVTARLASVALVATIALLTRQPLKVDAGGAAPGGGVRGRRHDRQRPLPARHPAGRPAGDHRRPRVALPGEHRDPGAAGAARAARRRAGRRTRRGCGRRRADHLPAEQPRSRRASSTSTGNGGRSIPVIRVLPQTSRSVASARALPCGVVTTTCARGASSVATRPDHTT